MTKKILITIIPIIVFLAGCQANEVKKTDLNQSPSQSLKTYESSKYGFSFQYPSNWNLYDYNNGNTNLAGINVSPENEKTLIDKVGAIGVNITAISPQKVEVNEEDNARRKLADSWIKTTKNFNKDVNLTLDEKEIVIDNLKVIKVDTKNIKIQSPSASIDSTDYILGNGSMYFFIYNGQRFKVAYTYPAQDENKYISTLDQIVLSLKFSSKKWFFDIFYG